MMKQIELRRKVLLSLQTALLGEVPPNLRGVTCDWDTSALVIHCIFDGEILEEDRESMECVATEVMANFPEDYQVRLECIRRDAPQLLQTEMPKKWVYRLCSP
jgi:hypothetical protein